MFDPKHPTNQSDPITPDEITDDDHNPNEIPADDGAPLYDWEIPTGAPDGIV